MITFAILLVATIILSIVIAVVLAIAGASAVVIFGDFIVCILIIVGLVKLFSKRGS